MDNHTYDMESEAEKELAEIIYNSQLESKFDIDKTLNDRAKKNNLTKINVKSLIKNVIMNADVATMLRQTLDSDVEANCLYEPKLTRAKIKEMLKTNPSSPYKDTSTTSECQLLIENELLDDSDDEEYTPQKEEDYDEDDDDDDNEAKCTSVNSSFETEVMDENCTSISENNTTINLNDKETICMRTRSKLSLNDTPLEVIEQAFIPPDFTEDMYDPVCHNDEWLEFLSEFTKPLEFVQNDDQNDIEDDPEYNVLYDDDFSDVDHEEFRIDKSVRISRKEYTSLINELSEFTDSFIQFNGLETDTNCSPDKNIVESKNSDESNIKPPDSKLIVTVPDESITKPNNMKIVNDTFYSLLYSDWNPPINSVNKQDISKSKKNTAYIPPTCSTYYNEENNNHQQINKDDSVSQCNKNYIPVNGMSLKQVILFKQQLTQHVQLLTQNYVLCTMTADFKKNCRSLTNLLKKIDDLSKNKLYAPINISTSFTFIQDWNEIYTNDKNMKDYDLLPLDVKEFMFYYDKPVFIYPELLPSRSYTQKLGTFPIGLEEEKILVLKMDYVFKNLKESHATKSKNKSKNLSDLLPMIINIVHRRWFKHRSLVSLKRFITTRKTVFKTSIMKNYLLHGKIEKANHIVDVSVLYNGNCLYSYDIDMFPPSWKSFIKQFMLK